MEQIRKSVFETNSSSTHSLTMCSVNTYELWKNEEVVLGRWTDGFLSFDELREKEAETKGMSDAEVKAWIKDADYPEYFLNPDDYYGSSGDYVEPFIRTSTVDGVGVVAFGYFGRD